MFIKFKSVHKKSGRNQMSCVQLTASSDPTRIIVKPLPSLRYVAVYVLSLFMLRYLPENISSDECCRCDSIPPLSISPIKAPEASGNTLVPHSAVTTLSQAAFHQSDIINRIRSEICPCIFEFRSFTSDKPIVVTPIYVSGCLSQQF
jgi:hypothetical protein